MNNVTYDKYLMSLRKWRNSMIIKLMAYDKVDDDTLEDLEKCVNELSTYESYLDYQRWSKQLARNDVS